MNHAFDSDELAPCGCGNPTLTIRFLSQGDRIISCNCGSYRPVTEARNPQSTPASLSTEGATPQQVPPGD